MRHILWTIVAGLLVAQAAYAQDGESGSGAQAGKGVKPKLPPPTLVKPRAGKDAAAPAPFAHLNHATLVFVANGAGDSTTVSDNLREVSLEARAPICIHNVRWSRFNDSCRDHLDQDGRRCAAYKLASTVLAIRKDAPQARIIFMGHSDGAHVVLLAAEMLPPASIERMFLFAPSVSTGYYLRPALAAARGGIDAFASRDDGVLECLEEGHGTADGHFGPTAGRFGFAVPPPVIGTDKKPHPDAAAFANFRQICWNPEQAGIGHGGHFTYVRPRFLRQQILPQLGF